MIGGLGRAFERLLLLSRFVVLVPVVVSILLACSALSIATVDAGSALGALPSYVFGDANAAHVLQV